MNEKERLCEAMENKYYMLQMKRGSICACAMLLKVLI